MAAEDSCFLALVSNAHCSITLITKQPKLLLKTRPRQLLDYLPLALVLSNQMLSCQISSTRPKSSLYICFLSQEIMWLRGATVARLTPDQKVACSNHVGVNYFSPKKIKNCINLKTFIPLQREKLNHNKLTTIVHLKY